MLLTKVLKKHLYNLQKQNWTEKQSANKNKMSSSSAVRNLDQNKIMHFVTLQSRKAPKNQEIYLRNTILKAFLCHHTIIFTRFVVK